LIQQFIFYCTDNILFEAFFNKKSIEVVYTLQSKEETVSGYVRLRKQYAL